MCWLLLGILCLLFSRFWNIFTIIILNFFFCRYLNYFLLGFVWVFLFVCLFVFLSCVLLVCSFIWAIFFYLFFFSLLHLMSPFLRLSGRIPSSFWFLPLLCKVVPVVCVGCFWVWLLFVLWWKEVRFCFCFCFVLFFPSDEQGCMRWQSCLLMTGFVFLSFCFFGWGILHWVLLAVGWCQVYRGGGFYGNAH